MTQRTRLHKHWSVPLRSKLLRDSLRKPRYWTADREKVDRSPYPYGVLRVGQRIGTDQNPYEGEIYYLSILSVLHRWTGFSIKWQGED